MREWYLLTPETRPNAIGGYEDQSFKDYKDDAFQEALTTDIAITVTLFTSDLSAQFNVRCIVQNNTADTQLKSLERTILFSIGTARAGMYVFFEGRYWLITGYPGNNGIYEKVTVVLCQYKFKWQTGSGKIIERWGNLTSASKYDTGRTGNQVILLESNNFTILLPEDDESATFEDKRIFIDRDQVNPHKVFRITRSDDVLYLYGENHGGVLSFIASRDEFNKDVDRPDLGMCDYIEVTEDNGDIDETTISIIGEDTLKYGIKQLYQVEGITGEYTWNVVTSADIQKIITGDGITLGATNLDDIGGTISLQVLYNNEVKVEKEIKITGLF